MGKTTLRDFVGKVEDLEGIKLRAWGEPDTVVDDYDYKRCAAENTSITDFIDTRIKPKLEVAEGKSVPVEIIDGNYTKPHGRTSMGKLRKTYDDDK